MTILVIGGTGFIGYRLVRLLVARGETVACMDTNPSAHSFVDLGGKVSSIRGDVAQFDEVMAAMKAVKPERVVNLAYLIGSNHAPQRGARAANATYLLDNSRLRSEFGIQYPPFRERVLQMINETRRDIGLPPVG